MDEFAGRYERLYVLAFRAAMRLGCDVDAARDVAAEACARAFSRWPQVWDHAEAWVTRVAVNVAIDSYRRANRHRPALIAAPHTDPLDRLVLDAHLAALPRRQREALTLRFLLDFDESRAAAVLGVSVATLHSHVTAGLRRLRRTVPSSLVEEMNDAS